MREAEQGAADVGRRRQVASETDTGEKEPRAASRQHESIQLPHSLEMNPPTGHSYLHSYTLLIISRRKLNILHALSITLHTFFNSANTILK